MYNFNVVPVSYTHLRAHETGSTTLKLYTDPGRITFCPIFLAVRQNEVRRSYHSALRVGVCYEALLHRYCLTYLLVLMCVLVVIHHCPYSSIVVVLCPWRAAAALRFTELSRRCLPAAEHVMSHRRFALSGHGHVCQMLTDR